MHQIDLNLYSKYNKLNNINKNHLLRHKSYNQINNNNKRYTGYLTLLKTNQSKSHRAKTFIRNNKYSLTHILYNKPNSKRIRNLILNNLLQLILNHISSNSNKDNNNNIK